MKVSLPILLIPVLLVMLVIALVMITMTETQLRTNIPVFPLQSGNPLPSGEPDEEQLGACYRSDDSACTQTTEDDCYDGAVLARWYGGFNCIPINACNAGAGEALVEGLITTEQSVVADPQDCENHWGALGDACLNKVENFAVDQCLRFAQQRPRLCGIIPHVYPTIISEEVTPLEPPDNDDDEPSASGSPVASPGTTYYRCQVRCGDLFQCGINPA
jgi:hypothetical protein